MEAAGTRVPASSPPPPPAASSGSASARYSSSSVRSRNGSPGGAGWLFRMNSHSSISAIGLRTMHFSCASARAGRGLVGCR